MKCTLRQLTLFAEFFIRSSRIRFLLSNLKFSFHYLDLFSSLNIMKCDKETNNYIVTVNLS